MPPFLASIDDPRIAQGGFLKGCPVCGGMSLVNKCSGMCRQAIAWLGLGHSISNCPKLEETQRRQMASHRNVDGGGY